MTKIICESWRGKRELTPQQAVSVAVEEYVLDGGTIESLRARVESLTRLVGELVARANLSPSDLQKVLGSSVEVMEDNS